ncbi:MAG: O-antigen ligase [Pseudomonadota bacterium]
MSSIETQAINLDRERLAHFASAWRAVLITIGLVVLWLSFEPFSGGQEYESGGSLINQLGYTGLTGLTLLTLLTCSHPAFLFRLLSTPWLLLFTWVLIAGIVISPEGDDAARGAVFSVIVAIMAACLVACAPSERALVRALTIASGLLLFLSYAGLFGLPNASIHTAAEAEPQHSGLWRGVFVHKNVAGPVMASLLFVGLYVMRRGQAIFGFIIALGAFVFVYKTGSKTSLALAPLVILAILAPGVLGLRSIVPLIAIAAIVSAHALTIGTVYFDDLDAIVRLISPDTTFTGRTEIWAFAKDYLWEYPITGFGFGGFWGTPFVLGAEQPFDRVWDPRGIVHGHNGFLDALLLFGLPGLLLLIWVTTVAPAIQYARAPRMPANNALNDLLLMIVLFAVLNASLESFFFNRADPVWLTLVFALFGLRMSSRFSITR